jgi:hypothetical protein
MTMRELELTELVGELLEAMRWMQVLGFSNQYLLAQKLGVTQEERDSVLAAATRAAEQDGRFHGWRERLARIKAATARAERDIARERGHTGGARGDAAGDA